MLLSDCIKVLRQKTLMTQFDFAKAIHVSPTTVNRWETGKMKPNISAMKAIKEFCADNGISYSDIEDAWINYSTLGDESHGDKQMG